MDFLPTFAGILGVDLPDDRPIDGVDQADYLKGEKTNSNRESVLTFVHDRLAAAYGAELIDAHTTYFSVEITAPAENLMAFGLFNAAFDGLSARVASGHEPLAAW